MAWETFKGRNRRAPGELAVTLGKTGSIGLNATVVKHIGDYRFVLLMFDAEKKLMGMKFMKQRDPHSYPVKTTAKDNHGMVSGVSFMKTYGIFPSKTKSYPAKFDEHNKMLIIDLNTEQEEKQKKINK